MPLSVLVNTDCRVVVVDSVSYIEYCYIYLCSRKAIGSNSQVSTTTSASSSLTPTSAAASAADSVDMLVCNRLNDNLGKLSALNDRRDDGNRNVYVSIYDSIDNVLTLSENVSSSQAGSPRLSASASAFNLYDKIDNVLTLSENVSSSQAGSPRLSASASAFNLYDKIDDVPVEYYNMTASSSSPTLVQSSTPEPPAATAAETSFSIDADAEYLSPTGTTKSTNKVSCFYQLEPNIKPSDHIYINC